MSVSDVQKLLQNVSFEKYYGFPRPDPENTIFDIIDPTESFSKPSFGYKMSKREFSDPDKLRGFHLCCPQEIKRGDIVRYAVKKRSGVEYVTGGLVRWVDGMLPKDVDFDTNAFKRDGGYREDIASRYTMYTSLGRPKYISLTAPSDSKKRWSVQLSGQKVFFWRLPAITQQERQDMSDAMEFAKEIEVDPGMATAMIDFAKFINSATSDELYALADARKEEERQRRKDKKNNVKNISL